MKTRIFFFAVLSLGLMNCQTYRNVYYNYDKSIDFTQYSTFAWAPDSGLIKDPEFENTPYDNDIVRNNAKNYITHVLTQRGLLVNTDSPDVVMELVLLNEKKELIATYPPHFYSGYYFYNPFYFPYYYPYYRYYTWYGWGAPYWDRFSQYTQTYVKGTITINMYDRMQEKLVWTGSAEGDIYDPAYIQFDVHPAIDKILKNFPVKPGVKTRPADEIKLKDKIVRTNNYNHFDNYNHIERNRHRSGPGN